MNDIQKEYDKIIGIVFKSKNDDELNLAMRKLNKFEKKTS